MALVVVDAHHSSVDVLVVVDSGECVVVVDRVVVVVPHVDVDDLDTDAVADVSILGTQLYTLFPITASAKNRIS